MGRHKKKTRKGSWKRSEVVELLHDFHDCHASPDDGCAGCEKIKDYYGKH